MKMGKEARTQSGRYEEKWAKDDLLTKNTTVAGYGGIHESSAAGGLCQCRIGNLLYKPLLALFWREATAAVFIQ